MIAWKKQLDILAPLIENSVFIEFRIVEEKFNWFIGFFVYFLKIVSNVIVNF